MLASVTGSARKLSSATAIVVSITVLVLGMVLNIYTPPNRALAAGTCQVTSLNPHTAPSGADTGFAVTITDSVNKIAWVQITSPSPNLEIYAGSSDWLPTFTTDGTNAVFTGDPIDAGNPLSFNVVAHVAYFAPSNWTVSASADQGGASPFSCTGDTSITITDNNPPVIETLSASALATSATINWTTDKPTDARVDYGLTSSYDSSVTDATFSTSHTVTITGLTATTTYHYMVTSVDQGSNSVTSDDATFITAAAPPPPPPSDTGGGSGSGGSGSTTSPIGTKIIDTGDKTPATIRLTSTIPHITAAVPKITGSADDNSGLVKIEYSTDGGKNWLAVDTTTGIGTKHATFSFTPLNLEDDTYSIVARAVDNGGNLAATTPVEMVIDTLPPTVGGNIISFGPQVLQPDSSGVVNTLTNITLRITTSTKGGATDLNISAVNVDATSKNALSSNFTLMRDTATGLWNGNLSFTTPGNYQLVAHALDGAGNKTVRVIDNVAVARPGLVLSAKGPTSSAQLTVYYLDPDTDSWIVWDAAPYGQINPQITNKQGGYSLLLPAGTYYIGVSASGFRHINTASFTIQQPQPVTAVLRLQPQDVLSAVYGSWFTFGVTPVTLAGSSAHIPAAFTKQLLVGETLPEFTLNDTTNTSHNSVNWLGRPTVITMMSTWVPTTAQQVSELSKLAGNHDINILPVGIGESVARLRAYGAIDGSSLTWLADPNGTLAGTLQTGSMPTHYFIDRKGIIRREFSGILSSQQILDYLSDL